MMHFGETHIKAQLQTGRICPFGATIAHGGMNLILYSRSAAGVEFLFCRPVRRTAFFNYRQKRHDLAPYQSQR